MKFFRRISKMKQQYRLLFRATSKIVLLSTMAICLYTFIASKSETKFKDLKHRSKSIQTESKRTFSIYQIDAASSIRIKRKKHKQLSLKKIDWHNYTFIEHELQRTGIGEHGKAAFLPDQNASEVERLRQAEGYNTALADKISLNRSLPDIRHPACQSRLYIESLPKVSIIIVFHNEHWTTLLRTLYSVINRSPEKLIKEIFLVDDVSDQGLLKENLDEYVEKYWPKVKVIRLSSRGGVVGARLAGAKLATADVLVFLDSHIEVNVNWLPPLLEPIALDGQTSVVPIIDAICTRNFRYYKIDDGARGVFNFGMYTYTRIHILPDAKDKLPDPFETPFMNGGAFAISRSFFWKLGGYDPGIKIWGCEQLELSLKIWQCGGRLLEAPCSRVGHLYRNVKHPVAVHGSTDYFYRTTKLNNFHYGVNPEIEKKLCMEQLIFFLDFNVDSVDGLKNLRRVADVWMDEYAKIKYDNEPSYVKFDPGDLRQQKALRRKLKCKPFKWFVTQIAFDWFQQFPLIEPKPYAEGRIRPKFSPHLCIDGIKGECGSLVRITKCDSSQDYIYQYFELSWHNDLKIGDSFWFKCVDVVNATIGALLKLYDCHGHGGNQQWRYYENTQHLVCLADLCLDHDPVKLELFLGECDDYSETQQWTIDTVRSERLQMWDPSNTDWITGPLEEWSDDD